MKKSIIIALIALLAIACTKDTNIDNNHPSTTGMVAFVIDDNNGTTRGTPITNASELKTMGVFCAATGTNDWTTSASLNKMFNERLNNNSGTWSYENDDIHWDATSLADRYTFFAYAPYQTAENGISVNAVSIGKPILNYIVPTDVTKQPDLMVAIPRYNLRPTGAPVALKMEHALTCVGFQISGNGEKIKDIALSSISTSGTLTIDGSSISWNNLNAPQNTNFSASLNYDNGQNYYTAGSDMSSNLITGNGYLMMIPQAMNANSKIILTLDDDSTREISLENVAQWSAGQKVNYMITITPLGTITIAPQELLLPYIGSNTVYDNIQVICQDNDGNDVNIAWTITTPATWLKLTTNSNGSGTSNTISGIGSKTIYTIATENSSTTTERTTTISIGDITINVRQSKTPISLPPDNSYGTPLPNTYAGAFWRAGEKGERIIRIPITSTTNAGDWTAMVIWMDGRWGTNDGVILSTDSLSSSDLASRGITWNNTTENPSNPELCPVKGDASIINGNVSSGGYITFRIGLKTTYTPTTAYPARYAVVLLSYKNNTLSQKLYLRQGENPDYVMSPNDAFSSGSTTISSRPSARKFSPYNLTAPAMTTSHPQLELYGGVFTEYPTQAGAFFQWAMNTSYYNQNQLRRAFHPTHNGVADWSQNTATDYWDIASATSEVCPSGYHRPNNGDITAAANILDINSEVRQSLFVPLMGNESFTANSITGYYADGFFDRHALNTSSSEPFAALSAVSWISRGINNSANVAYKGNLIFNPITTSDHYNASLFIPATGYRAYDSGNISSAGSNGSYWTSSANGSVGAITFTTSYCAVFSSQYDRLNGYSVRCVKN